VTTSPWVRVERLNQGHDLESFRCGSVEVDGWFQAKARANAHLIATYVCLDGSELVRAFFALKYIVVSVDGYPNALRRGSDRDGCSVAILLAYMGLDTAVQGTGAGRALIREALMMSAQAHSAVPVQIVAVDALDEELVGFYEKAGFRRVSPSERRLLIPMSAVLRSLDATRG
jgi:GNAT superfamily N-acetyltransferase